MDVWAFLSDPAHQATLKFLGGGLAVVCGGLWTVVTFFRKPKPASEPKPSITIVRGLSGWPLVLLVAALAGAGVFASTFSAPRVTVERGIGVGGNVEGSSLSVTNP